MSNTSSGYHVYLQGIGGINCDCIKCYLILLLYSSYLSFLELISNYWGDTLIPCKYTVPYQALLPPDLASTDDY